MDWYAITENLDVDRRGPIELAGAFRIIDEYASRLRPHYESGEIALAETMFGFSREDDDFIEITLHSLQAMTLTVELPPSDADDRQAMRRGFYQRDFAIDSLDALKRHVTAYFTLTADQFKLHLQGTPRQR